MELVSIIIPAYNRAHLICQTLDSILRQSYCNIEIIVVDDGSKDATREVILEKYSGKVVYILNVGQGPGAARNTGLSAAKGRFIKFFDSDDVMTEDSIEAQVNCLICTGKQYVTTPYFYASHINGEWKPEENEILNYYPFPTCRSLSQWMIRDLFITIPGMLFRRELLMKVGPWPTHITTSEDWLYLWQIARHEPFPAHTNLCAFAYRTHARQSTGENLSMLRKDKEKFEVLSSIYKKDIETKNSFSLFEKLLFRNKFYQISRVNRDQIFKSELLAAAGYFQNLVWLFRRLELFVGRCKTNTKWQPMHGVLKNDYEVMQRYLKAL